MCVDRFHIVSLFLSNPCTPSTLSKEAFVYFVCPTEIPQPPFAWKCYLSLSLVRALSPYLSRRFQSAHAVHVFFTLAFDRSLPASLPPFLQTISLSLSSVLCLPPSFPTSVPRPSLPVPNHPRTYLYWYIYKHTQGVIQWEWVMF